MGRLKEGSPFLGQDLNKPLRPEEYPSPEEIESLTGESKVGRRKFLYLGLVFTVPVLASACNEVSETPAVVRTPEEVGLPPTPTLEPPPTFEPTITPEPAPKPTVVVETLGFGGLEELTEEEQQMALGFEQAYRGAAQTQGLEGTVVLTRGDEEGEIGAFLRDGQGDLWSLVTRAEMQALEQVPVYEGTSPEWNPNETRFEYLVREETFIYVPQNRLLLDGEGTVVAEWNTESSLWEETILEPTPEVSPTAEPAEECVVENCEPYQEMALYHDFSDEQSFSRLVPGTNKTFLVTDRRDGRMLIEVTEPNGAKWEAWADDNSGAYGPIGQAPPPPTPETPPPVYCEAPHFGGRTPDRKTGYIDSFGNYIQDIRPEGNPLPPHYRWWRRAHGSPWVTKREGMIKAIDRNAQIVTFDLGSGLVVQRRFTRNTQVVMSAHIQRQGMSYDEVRPTGGNFCDFEVGDAAAILHPNEGEGASPSPEGNLWGVLIVQ